MILAERKVDLALTFAKDALVLERGRIAFRGKTADAGRRSVAAPVVEVGEL